MILLAMCFGKRLRIIKDKIDEIYRDQGRDAG